MAKASFRALGSIAFQNSWFSFKRGDIIELQYENEFVSIKRDGMVCCVQDCEVIKLIFEHTIDIIEIVDIKPKDPISKSHPYDRLTW